MHTEVVYRHHLPTKRYERASEVASCQLPQCRHYRHGLPQELGGGTIVEVNSFYSITPERQGSGVSRFIPFFLQNYRLQ